MYVTFRFVTMVVQPRQLMPTEYKSAKTIKNLNDKKFFIFVYLFI